MIFGVAHQRARMLEQMGIADYDALQQAPAEDIVAYFRAAKRPVSLAEVARWKEHAESYRRGEVNIFQPFPHLGDHFVVLDLEYEPVAADVWLIGACHVTPQRQEYVSFWSSSPRQCRSALRALEEFRYLTKACPIVTWNGLGADLPILERACNRLGLDQLGHLMRYRHVDLYDWAAKSMRLPIPSLSLKEVSSYFGIPRTTDIQDGLQAQMLYEQYRRLKPSAEREAVKRRLVHYNREDIEVLVEFIRKLEHVRVRAAAPTLQPPPI